MEVAGHQRPAQRTDTEEELRRLRNRQELYGLRKQLHEQEVQDAARNQNRTEAREQSMAASIRLPQAPAAPPNVLAVLRDTLPLPAVRQAQSATHLGARLGEPIEASESLVNFARLAQQARLTPLSGQNESQEKQAMVGKSEVTTQKEESSMAEQGAEQQAEKASLEEAEAQAMKWWEVLQAKRKIMSGRHELRHDSSRRCSPRPSRRNS